MLFCFKFKVQHQSKKYLPKELIMENPLFDCKAENLPKFIKILQIIL